MDGGEPEVLLGAAETVAAELPAPEPLLAAVRAGWRAQITQLASVGAAAALHLALLVVLLPGDSEQPGDGGTELEAIAVTMVSEVPIAVGAPEIAPQPAPTEAAPEAQSTPSDAAQQTPRAEAEPPPPPIAALALPPEPEPPEEAPVTLPVAEPKPEPEPPRELAKVEPRPEARETEKPREAANDKKEEPEEETAEPVRQAAAPAPAAAMPAQPPPVSAAPVSAGAMQAYARQIALTLAKSRPKGVGVSGTVRIRFVVSTDGTAAGADVVTSSGKPRLDQLAVAAIQRNAFPPPPAGATESQRTFIVPYQFR